MKKKYTKEEIEDYIKEVKEVNNETRRLRKAAIIWIGTLLTAIFSMIVLMEMGYYV